MKCIENLRETQKICFLIYKSLLQRGNNWIVCLFQWG